MGWPEDWDEQLSGRRCRLCEEGRPEDTGRALRFYGSDLVDAYLARKGLQRGFAVVIWRKGHVVEPTDLGEDDTIAFWLEVLRVGRAMERHFEAIKMNYQILGNQTLHLHAIVAARFKEDVAPGGPIPASSGELFSERQVLEDAGALRRILAP